MENSQTVWPSTTSTQHTHTVIFLHGRGDNVRNFVPAIHRWINSESKSLLETFPSFRWIFPQAKSSPAVSNPGINWPQWFDVYNVRDFSDREEEQAPGLRRSVSDIRELLAKEAALLHGRWDRLILMGISQGGATSIHTLINLDIPGLITMADERREQHQEKKRLGAVIGYSCRLPFAGRSLSKIRQVLSLDDTPTSNGDNDDRNNNNNEEILKNTPILLEHCIDDPLVLIESGRGLRDTLREFGASVEWKEYPRGGHWLNSPQGADDAIEFIRTHVLNGIEPEMVTSPVQTRPDDVEMGLS